MRIMAATPLHVLLLLHVLLPQAWAAAAFDATAPNILFVVYDDLRPQLSSFGHGGMKTPNFDSLAAESLVFHRAYTNYPYCAPSRNRSAPQQNIRQYYVCSIDFSCIAVLCAARSFMSGRMPDHAQDWNFIDSFRQRCKESPSAGKTCEDWEGTAWTALPEFFKRNGYWTVGTGIHSTLSEPVRSDCSSDWAVREHMCECRKAFSPEPAGG